MNRVGKIAIVMFIVALGIPQIASAQTREAVVDVTGTIVKISGGAVIFRNETTKELKMFTDIPDGVEIYVDNKKVPFSDLREGMTLHALQFRNVPAPVVVTQAEVEKMPSTPAPAPKPAPKPAPAPAPAAEPEMPKTASQLPMVALLGFLMLAAGVAMRRYARAS